MKADINSQTSSVRTSLFCINNMTSNSNRLLILLGGSTSQDGKLIIQDEGSSNTDIEFTSPQIIANNECHHIVYVRDGSMGLIYIDGILEGTHNANFTISSDDLFSIGQEWDNLTTSPTTSQFYNGNIDDFRIWTEARTNGQIQANMNHELTGNETNLLVYYSFNQGISGGNNIGITSVTDNSQNNINANLNSFSLFGTSSNFMLSDCNIIETNIIENNTFLINDMLVYPNPNRGEFNILSKEETIESIEVFNILGEQIINKNVNDKLISIDIRNYSKGIYFVKLKSVKNHFITLKVIFE